ncbi:MAG TPA: ABC transporter permease [Dinghuibacter sp.]|jgi:ABC-type antimicrobial peptide transport system permease subunit|uniref:ABC transporter permease n=1 Tax=Dinghuibacter sp. TaxID=2024697 RepID=UPI002BFB22E5|nr:ABC transporter permease [Dinghuibacter sp.]HTJ11296.1 ABC transporter permease [Dinghuibacter sp.]
MLRNIITISIRNLQKHRVHSLINIAGLTAGMALTLLIALWITDEFSFDHYTPNHGRIGVAMHYAYLNDQNGTSDVIPMPWSNAFSQYSTLFTHTAITSSGSFDALFSDGGRVVSGKALWAQMELPRMFGFRFIEGDLMSAKDPTTVLISQSLATALFGSADPIGRMVKGGNEVEFKVGGVYEDLPRNTTFYGLQAILPWYNKVNTYFNTNTDWNDHNGHLYVELAPGVTFGQATDRVRHVPSPHITDFHEDALIYPLDKAHLWSDFKNGQPDGGPIRFVWLFGTIGLFVLLLACINFMNLSTARSERRAKEVGIRKTIGSFSRQLIAQFLFESVLVALIAAIGAIAIVQLALPFFNQLAAKDVHIPWAEPIFWLALLGFAVLTGLLAGSYPAFYLSSFNPVKVLKGTFKAGRLASLPRQVLVVLQFTVSLTLVISTVIVFRQILFTKDRPVGYARDGLFTVEMNTPEIRQHYEALRTELLQSGLASNVAASDLTPTNFAYGNGMDWPGKRPEQIAVTFNNVDITPDYGQTIGWRIISGRDLSSDYLTDSNAVILNAKAVKEMGVKDPIGLPVKLFGTQYHVVGVAADIISGAPYDTVMPAVFVGGRYTGGNVIVRIKPGLAPHTALEQMEPIFKRYNPASPFIYKFVDLEYAAKFAAQERIGNLAAVFTGLAIFISCLGLFGLAAFVAERRTKEIGVRKVLGAGVLSLWGLLSKEFLWLTSLSILIAVPLSWYGMHTWIESYSYRAPLSWWIFGASSAGILLITLVTVSFQSLKAALMNPVRSLRTE